MTEVRNLCSARGAEVIHDLNFRLPNGRLCAVAGQKEDGSGLLLRLLAGCFAPDSGSVRVGGFDPVGIRGRIGFLPAPAPFYPDLSPKEFLKFVLDAKGVRGERAVRDVRGLLADAGIEEREAARPMRELDPVSAGLLGYAQAIAGSPDLLLVELPEGADLCTWGARLREYLTPERTVFVAVPAYHPDLGADFVLTLAGGLQTSFAATGAEGEVD